MGIININDEWETPITLYFQKCVQLGIAPKLDVCATPENTKCKKFFTIKDDALEQDWNQDFFMNPPYSTVDKFMEKAFKEARKFKVRGLILVYAKTDTRWWHRYIENNNKVKKHFHKGRIRFLLNGILHKHSAPYPSVWLLIN